ncbi:MAG: hypothetical protein HQK49_02720 [Oligoflexia bacterium]|nr:hypothetical protein [Oligoflexia bacterium]
MRGKFFAFIFVFIFILASCSKYDRDESYVNIVIKVPSAITNYTKNISEDSDANLYNIEPKEVTVSSVSDYNCFAVFITYPERQPDSQCTSSQGVVLVRPHQFIGFVERNSTLNTQVLVGQGRIFDLMAIKSIMGRCPDPMRGDMDGDANKNLISRPELIGRTVQDIPASITEQSVTLWGSFAERKSISDCNGRLFQWQAMAEVQAQATATTIPNGPLILANSNVKFDLRSPFNLSTIIASGVSPYTYTKLLNVGNPSMGDIGAGNSSVFTVASNYTPTPGFSTDTVNIVINDNNGAGIPLIATISPRMRTRDFNFMPNTATPDYFLTPVPLPSGWILQRSGDAYLTRYDGTLEYAIAETPRFEYEVNSDYLAGTSTASNTPTPIGFLIESYSQNLARTSEDLQNETYWRSSIPAVASAIAVTPNYNTPEARDIVISGSSCTDVLVDSSSTPTYLEQTIANPTPTQTYVFSIFVRKSVNANASSSAAIQILQNATDSTPSGLIVDLTSGTPALMSGLERMPPSGVKRYKNQWLRIWLTKTLSSTPSPALIRIFPAYSSTPVISSSSSIVADLAATGEIYAFGAQFELGYIPSSYIYTGGGPGSRNPDILVYTPAAPAFSPINSSAGTFYMKWYKSSDAPSDMTFLEISNPTPTVDANETPVAHLLKYDMGKICAYQRGYDPNPNPTCCVDTLNNMSSRGTGSVIYSYTNNVFYLSSSRAASAASVASCTYGVNYGPRVIPKITVGGNAIGNSQMNAHIQQLIYWEDTLSSQALPQVTP